MVGISHEPQDVTQSEAPWASRVHRKSSTSSPRSLLKPKTPHRETLPVDVDQEKLEMQLSQSSTGTTSSASCPETTSSRVASPQETTQAHTLADSESREQLLRDLAESMIGRNEPFQSAFGVKAQCYADYTASGKSLECAEQYIRREVMPLYGNTHTTTSVTGLQTTSFREEARQIIGRAVHARLSGPGEKDCVLFTGQGCTSAINKLVTALGINSGRRHRRAAKRPVVFTCPFSHHSNLLPWRESPCADEVLIPEAAEGGLDLVELEKQLRLHRHREVKIGSFAAASNLTGLLMDVDKVSTLLHKYGALACWDYAACAPYVDIDMNPVKPAAYKDAVFFSGHKFVGGPGSPGVLVVKKRHLANAVPTMPGGGTVLFVTEKAHSYLANRVEREEGGTPDILGSIRLGLAFELKQRVGPKHIMDLERKHVQHIRHELGLNSNIVLLGRHTDEVDQLPIFSFLIRFGDRFLHYNFVCALLNDLFGIQTRGGCQCAGPYGARLLGLNLGHIVELGYAVVAKHEVLKPGFSRMSFPYFADDSEVDYIVEAVKFVADHGWKLLPQYDFSCSTGVWRHVSRADVAFPTKKYLSDFQSDGSSRDSTSMASLPSMEIPDIAAHRRENLEKAMELADESIAAAVEAEVEPGQKVAETYEGLRWFVYPHEAVAAWKELGVKPRLSDEVSGPCQPQRYIEGTLNHQWDNIPSMAEMKRSPVKTAARMLMMACMPASKRPSYMKDLKSPLKLETAESDSEGEGNMETYEAAQVVLGSSPKRT